MKILIVDDDAALCYSLKRVLGNRYDIITAGTAADAVAALRNNGVNLVLLDIRLGEESGLDLLTRIRKDFIDVPVVMMTAYGTSDAVLQAMGEGAGDFLVKPVKPEELISTIERFARPEPGIDSDKRMPISDFESSRSGFIGSSRAMRDVLKLVASVAPSGSPVLVTGESGTGKEMVARLVHDMSGRTGSFVPVNCAAIPDELLESELFGYHKGAFTGASEDRAGMFEQAHGGTIFLDEIGELSGAIQAKLLRVLQDGTIQKLGARNLTAVDVRLVSATNKDLAAEVEKQQFRLDLFYRLNVVDVHIPPLRKRIEDIAPLAAFFARRYASQTEKDVTCIEHDVISMLESLPWPGNVRELQNVMRKAVVLATTPCLRISDFSVSAPHTETDIAGLLLDRFNANILEESVAFVEKELIERILKQNDGHLTNSATMLGISRVTLNAKLKKYGIEADDGK